MTTPMTPEIAKKLLEAMDNAHIAYREWEDGEFGHKLYGEICDLLVNAPAVYDAYIEMAKTIAYLEKLVKIGINAYEEHEKEFDEQAKVVGELVEALTEFSALEVKGHSLMSKLQFSDTGRALSAKINEALRKARAL